MFGISVFSDGFVIMPLSLLFVTGEMNRDERRQMDGKSSLDEVVGEWWRLPKVELNNLYSSPNIVRVIKSRRMRWAGHVARMGEERGLYVVLVGKPEGKRPLGRPKRRWVDNNRMYLQEVECWNMD